EALKALAAEGVKRVLAEKGGSDAVQKIAVQITGYWRSILMVWAQTNKISSIEKAIAMVGDKAKAGDEDSLNVLAAIATTPRADVSNQERAAAMSGLKDTILATKGNIWDESKRTADALRTIEALLPTLEKIIRNRSQYEDDDLITESMLTLGVASIAGNQPAIDSAVKLAPELAGIVNTAEDKNTKEVAARTLVYVVATGNKPSVDTIAELLGRQDHAIVASQIERVFANVGADNTLGVVKAFLNTLRDRNDLPGETRNILHDFVFKGIESLESEKRNEQIVVLAGETTGYWQTIFKLWGGIISEAELEPFAQQLLADGATLADRYEDLARVLKLTNHPKHTAFVLANVTGKIKETIVEKKQNAAVEIAMVERLIPVLTQIIDARRQHKDEVLVEEAMLVLAIAASEGNSSTLRTIGGLNLEAIVTNHSLTDDARNAAVRTLTYAAGRTGEDSDHALASLLRLLDTYLHDSEHDAVTDGISHVFHNALYPETVAKVSERLMASRDNYQVRRLVNRAVQGLVEHNREDLVTRMMSNPTALSSYTNLKDLMRLWVQQTQEAEAKATIARLARALMLGSDSQLADNIETYINQTSRTGNVAILAREFLVAGLAQQNASDRERLLNLAFAGLGATYRKAGERQIVSMVSDERLEGKTFSYGSNGAVAAREFLSRLPENMRDRKMTWLSRFDYQTALEMLLETEDQNDNRPLAILFYPVSDWNGAFDSHKDEIRLLRKTFKTRYYEVEGEDEFIALGNRLTQAQQAKLGLFAGHGEQKRLAFTSKKWSPENEKYFLDTGDERQFTGIINRWLDPSATVILVSCSTGKGGSREDNLANMFARLAAGRVKHVFAPIKPANITSISAERNGDVSAATWQYYNVGYDAAATGGAVNPPPAASQSSLMLRPLQRDVFSNSALVHASGGMKDEGTKKDAGETPDTNQLKGEVTKEELAGLIKQLDDDSFGVRQKASRELIEKAAQHPRIIKDLEKVIRRDSDEHTNSAEVEFRVKRMILPAVYRTLFKEVLERSEGKISLEEILSVLAHIDAQYKDAQLRDDIIEALTVPVSRLNKDLSVKAYTLLFEILEEAIRNNHKRYHAVMAMLTVLHIRIEQSPKLLTEVAGIKDARLKSLLIEVLGTKGQHVLTLNKEKFTYIAAGLRTLTPATKVEETTMRSLRIMFWGKASNDELLMRQVAEDPGINEEIREEARLRIPSNKPLEGSDAIVPEAPEVEIPQLNGFQGSQNLRNRNAFSLMSSVLDHAASDLPLTTDTQRAAVITAAAEIAKGNFNGSDAVMRNIDMEKVATLVMKANDAAVTRRFEELKSKGFIRAGPINDIARKADPTLSRIYATTHNGTIILDSEFIKVATPLQIAGKIVHELRAIVYPASSHEDNVKAENEFLFANNQRVMKPVGALRLVVEANATYLVDSTNTKIFGLGVAYQNPPMDVEGTQIPPHLINNDQQISDMFDASKLKSESGRSFSEILPRAGINMVRLYIQPNYPLERQLEILTPIVRMYQQNGIRVVPTFFAGQHTKNLEREAQIRKDKSLPEDAQLSEAEAREVYTLYTFDAVNKAYILKHAAIVAEWARKSGIDMIILGNEMNYYDLSPEPRSRDAEDMINLTSQDLYQFMNEQVAPIFKKANNDILVLLGTGMLDQEHDKPALRQHSSNFAGYAENLWPQWEQPSQDDPRFADILEKGGVRRTNMLFRPEEFTKRIYADMEFAREMKKAVLIAELGESSWQQGEFGIGETGQALAVRTIIKAIMPFVAGNVDPQYAKYPKVVIGIIWYGLNPQDWQVDPSEGGDPAEPELALTMRTQQNDPFMVRLKPAFYEFSRMINLFGELLQGKGSIFAETPRYVAEPKKEQGQVEKELRDLDSQRTVPMGTNVQQATTSVLKSYIDKHPQETVAILFSKGKTVIDTEGLAASFGNLGQLFSVDIAKETELARTYNVSGLPEGLFELRIVKGNKVIASLERIDWQMEIEDASGARQPFEGAIVMRKYHVTELGTLTTNYYIFDKELKGCTRVSLQRSQGVSSWVAADGKLPDSKPLEQTVQNQVNLFKATIEEGKKIIVIHSGTQELGIEISQSWQTLLADMMLSSTSGAQIDADILDALLYLVDQGRNDRQSKTRGSKSAYWRSRTAVGLNNQLTYHLGVIEWVFELPYPIQAVGVILKRGNEGSLIFISTAKTKPDITVGEILSVHDLRFTSNGAVRFPLNGKIVELPRVGNLIWAMQHINFRYVHQVGEQGVQVRVGEINWTGKAISTPDPRVSIFAPGEKIPYAIINNPDRNEITLKFVKGLKSPQGGQAYVDWLRTFKNDAIAHPNIPGYWKGEWTLAEFFAVNGLLATENIWDVTPDRFNTPIKTVRVNEHTIVNVAKAILSGDAATLAALPDSGITVTIRERVGDRMILESGDGNYVLVIKGFGAKAIGKSDEGWAVYPDINWDSVREKQILESVLLDGNLVATRTKISATVEAISSNRDRLIVVDKDNNRSLIIKGVGARYAGKIGKNYVLYPKTDWSKVTLKTVLVSTMLDPETLLERTTETVKAVIVAADAKEVVVLDAATDKLTVINRVSGKETGYGARISELKDNGTVTRTLYLYGDTDTLKK
ncbi:MAG: hypothetical protein KKF80_08325, partial [Candidatus Omnitrophica bacterium]|nr:hypothetical protein [Candidatus Omnitrophota bacterium]